MLLEKTLESPLDCKKIKPVNPEVNQSLIFTRRTDAEAEALLLGPPHAKNWLIGKDSDVGKDWRQEVKGMMVGWHHQLNGHEFGWTLGVGGGQGGLVCCVSWGRKSRTWLSDWTYPNYVEYSEQANSETGLGWGRERGLQGTEFLFRLLKHFGNNAANCRTSWIQLRALNYTLKNG